MKIGIVTQPLLNNYGGTLQNYALQTTLKYMGHHPITIDFIPKPSLFMYVLSCLKTIFFFFIPRKRHMFQSIPKRKNRNKEFEVFTSKYITTTRVVDHYLSSLISDYQLDAVIVGSDQVWRPLYNPFLKDSFLMFTQKHNVKRIAYAASFGVDKWEFSLKETIACKECLKMFDGISVREHSGIKLCKEYLDVDAIEVLDPTLLLSKNEYLNLTSNIPVCKEKYLAAYILDRTEEKFIEIQQIAKTIGLTVKEFSASKDATLSVPEWLAMFRDASYVVTDSFHGTVFSIIFEKEFKCIYNKERGTSRFESLLQNYQNNTFATKRELSLRFLKEHL
ncbi:polysaccharide pyruvyl transferase family protein [Bacteroides thetaiotaomicron]|uniref:polysaccharide pyruvyl transferase family protein n=1 Tax=Bacteroides thetaiotaomicron TaxID=818 RepID=UPI00356B0B71